MELDERTHRVSARWYVAQTVAGRDNTFRFYLDLLGLQVLLPILFENKKPTRLYPGYAFIRFSQEDPWHQINNSPGVIKLLPVNREQPKPLPVGFVEELQAGIEGGSFTPEAAEDLVAKYQPNREVKVVDGPFSGHVGKLVRHEGGALVLLMSLFGRSFEAPFDRRQVA